MSGSAGRAAVTVLAEAGADSQWVSLCRWLGWDVRLEAGGLGDALGGEPSHLIIDRDPARLGDGEVAALGEALQRGDMLAIAPAADPGGAFAALSGAVAGERRPVAGSPRWSGPGEERSWSGWLHFEAPVLGLSAGAVPWAFAGGTPLAAARRFGDGALVSLSASAAEIRDAGQAGSGILRHLLIHGTSRPLAWLDLEGTVIVRMDDPGSAANIHLRSWAHPELGGEEWSALATELTSRDARMSACCVPGWIDDGDAERGELRVDGEAVERVAGAVHPSPGVVYRGADGTVHDYEDEFRGLLSFRAAGAGELEQHGYTHIGPDREAWTRADDRYESVSWYRELERIGPQVEAFGPADPIAAGGRILTELLGELPSTLTCPGQACSPHAAELAEAAGFELVATEALALRDGERLVWDPYVVCAGIDYPDPSLLESGIPVQAVLHDRDVALEGVSWLGRWLDAWTEAGARRFVDFRELAGLLGVRVGLSADGDVEVEPGERFPPLRAIPVGWRSSQGLVAGRQVG